MKCVIEAAIQDYEVELCDAQEGSFAKSFFCFRLLCCSTRLPFLLLPLLWLLLSQQCARSHFCLFVFTCDWKTWASQWVCDISSLTACIMCQVCVICGSVILPRYSDCETVHKTDLYMLRAPSTNWQWNCTHRCAVILDFFSSHTLSWQWLSKDLFNYFFCYSQQSKLFLSTQVKWYVNQYFYLYFMCSVI